MDGKMENKETQTVIPLSALIQNARSYLNNAVVTVMNQNNLPPYLMDGIISEILADIRKQELAEIDIFSPLQKEAE